MAAKIRTTVKAATASGGRTSWFKMVTAVDLSKTNGYAFEGDFVKIGVEVEVELGAILIEKEPCGSVKNPHNEGNIWRVVEDETDNGRGHHLELVESWSWEKSFLSFRDAVAKALIREVMVSWKKEHPLAVPDLDPLVESIKSLIATHGIGAVMAVVVSLQEDED